MIGDSCSCWYYKVWEERVSGMTGSSQEGLRFIVTSLSCTESPKTRLRSCEGIRIGDALQDGDEKADLNLGSVLPSL